MEEVQVIAEKLRGPPFNKDLRLVELDEKSPIELLQLLNDIFASMDSTHQVDIREENDEARAQRMMSFITMLKFSFADESQRDAYLRGLISGEKPVVYNVMHWVLVRYPALSKRAYLAKYLMPVEIAPEVLVDDYLLNLNQQLKELQEQFKQTHKAVDQLRSSNLRPNELRGEISQLEEERKQLNEKIKKQQRAAEGEQGFAELLAATSELRREQENEAKVQDRLRDQRMQLQQAEATYAELNRRMQDMRGGTVQTNSAEALLRQLEQEVNEWRNKIDNDLTVELNERRSRLATVEQERRGPIRNEADVADLRRVVESAESEVNAIKNQVEEALERDPKLTMFRHSVSLASNKLRTKEDEVEVLQEQKTKVRKELEDKEARLAPSAASSGGARMMSEREIADFKTQLREKFGVYNSLKSHMKALKAETAVLQLTEQVLKSRHTDLDRFLSEMERKKGISGYRDVVKALDQASADTAKVDAVKGKTLEEISRIVEEIGRRINDKKSELAPLLSELKNTRKRFQDVETEYTQKKQVYEKTAVGLEVEKQQLENECDAFQDECLREESRYHFLNSLINITQVQLQRAKFEEQCQHGDKRLLRDISSLKELYTNKLVQQEHLTKQLRMQQKDIRENENDYAQQKRMFTNLRSLLDVKLRVKQRQVGFDSKQTFSGDMMIGGANVMRMD